MLLLELHTLPLFISVECIFIMRFTLIVFRLSWKRRRRNCIWCNTYWNTRRLTNPTIMSSSSSSWLIVTSTFCWIVGLSLFALMIVEQCPLQTPPFWAKVAHSSKLQCFLSTLCVIQIPPLTGPFVDPSWLQRFAASTSPLRHVSYKLLPSGRRRYTFWSCIVSYPPWRHA